ncbi:MAG: cytochrome c [Gemmatimonadaceae bacterium]
MRRRILSFCVLGGAVLIGAARTPARAVASFDAALMPILTLDEDGQMLYRRNCRTCHGAAGEPSAETRRKYPTIKVLNDSAFLAGLSDDSILVVLRNGKGKDMKSWSDVLTEEEMAAVVQYVRTLPGARAPG